MSYLLDTIVNSFEDEELLIATGFDDAVIGIDTDSMRLIYSVKKVLDILMLNDNMSFLEAREYFDFNVGGAFVGDKTPI